MKKEIFTYRKIVFVLSLANIILISLTTTHIILMMHVRYPYQLYFYETGIQFLALNIAFIVLQYTCLWIKESVDQEKAVWYGRILDYSL